MSVEYRIKQFYELHNNKWFHIMNWSLDIIKLSSNYKERFMLTNYGSCFYF